jgi:small subunit ribosomal protein S9
MADEEQPASPNGESTEEETTPNEAVAEGAANETEQDAATETPAETSAPTPEPLTAEAPAPTEQPAAPAEPVAAQEPAAAVEAEEAEDEQDEEEPAPREKPSVPGAHLEVDIVPEGVDPLGRSDSYEDAYAVDPYATDDDSDAKQEGEDDKEQALSEPISTAAIDLASGARYRATGKRKSAIARVTLRPGSGSYLVNGRTLEEHFPRLTLQRNIRQPLETVGYEDRMDVVARLHGGGISAQAGALRHGVSRALLEADPNLRGELKRRGFLTRDSRAKERKKAGLKKARKKPQFSKR